jgi:hypothetical protein
MGHAEGMSAEDSRCGINLQGCFRLKNSCGGEAMDSFAEQAG